MMLVMMIMIIIISIIYHLYAGTYDYTPGTNHVSRVHVYIRT
jgi:hypothetical protein